MDATRFLKLEKKPRGSVVVFVAIGIIMMLGIAAIVVDLGMGYNTKTQLQNAADAAALAGAGVLTGSNLVDARAIAHSVGLKHKASGSDIDFTVDNNIGEIRTGNWNGNTFDPNGTPINAVRVQNLANNTQHTSPIFFAKIFGSSPFSVGFLATAYHDTTSGNAVIANQLTGQTGHLNTVGNQLVGTPEATTDTKLQSKHYLLSS